MRSKVLAGALLSLALSAIGPAGSQEVAVGTCPNYTIDSLSGRPICRTVVNPGETIFYWLNEYGALDRTKHIFEMYTAEDHRRIEWAVFSWYTSGGALSGQAWTSQTQDDWQYIAKDNDGDNFFEAWCEMQGGRCAPITNCNVAVVSDYYGEMVKFYNQATLANNPLYLSYATEMYTRANRYLHFCQYIARRQGPRDERENVVPP